MLREPDLYIGGKENPYLLRWYITPWSRYFKDKNWQELSWWQKIVRSLPNIYLHKFLRDDNERALHDHPWVSISVLLKGGLSEVTKHRAPFLVPSYYSPEPIFIDTERHWIRRFRFKYRPAEFAHRLMLNKDLKTGKPIPAWTLFITGPKVREWGFLCPKGWRHWKVFTAGDHGELIGRGCD